ncbi:hypothetical protein BaRGS_00017350 [Batillaria attramentaria]|uniref:Uncharacterized protein n=1 Tax=Batillaria attramentaria TaxID=370345 RepID=A0ABD0KVX6_9CAEN
MQATVIKIAPSPGARFANHFAMGGRERQELTIQTCKQNNRPGMGLIVTWEVTEFNHCHDLSVTIIIKEKVIHISITLWAIAAADFRIIFRVAVAQGGMFPFQFDEIKESERQVTAEGYLKNQR